MSTIGLTSNDPGAPHPMDSCTPCGHTSTGTGVYERKEYSMKDNSLTIIIANISMVSTDECEYI